MRKLTETHFVSLRCELLSCNRNEFILMYAIIAVQLLSSYCPVLCNE